MAHRDFRWHPHRGKRHAIARTLVPDDEAETLCGDALVIPRTLPTKQQWCWPTCRDCDLTWRQREGIPPIPHQVGADSRAAHSAARSHSG